MCQIEFFSTCTSDWVWLGELGKSRIDNEGVYLNTILEQSAWIRDKAKDIVVEYPAVYSMQIFVFA